MQTRTVLLIPLILLLAACSGPSHVGVDGVQSTKSERKLRKALGKIMADESLDAALIGVRVIDPRTGRELFAHHPGLNMAPASNVKLYTSAAVLDQLGPDYRYRTVLEATSSTIADGVLRGDLIVLGSGDPVIGGRFTAGDRTATFRAWADSLKSMGIHTIDGRILGIDDYFDDLQLGYGWSWDDEPWWYSAEISALSFNDNTVDFTLEPTALDQPGILTWEPGNTTYVTVENASRTVGADLRLDEGYTRVRDGNRMVVSTSVPADYTETESISIHNPTQYFVHVLREVLEAEDIEVRGDAMDADALEGDALDAFDLHASPRLHIATHTSPPLSDIVRVINKVSHNLYAEQVLKTLGAVRPDTASSAAAGSAAMGWVVGKQTLDAAGIDAAGIRLVDGSGLSRMNLVSARTTTTLLRFMWNHPDATVRQAFLESLPIAGVDGTLASRMRETPAAGNARAKTGTLTGASALSGYVTTAGGSELAFSVMVNNHTVPTSRARSLQDAVVATLAAHRR